MIKLFLGVDGGGSHTRIAVINNEEKVLAQIEGESTNLNILGSETVSENLANLVGKALNKLNYDSLYGCFALAGVNFPSDLKIWQQVIAKHTKLISLFTSFPLIINDTKAALRSGTTSSDSVVIISGTGSNCYGRNSKDDETSCGGGDYILSDQGSGYSIGLQILKSVTKQLDERGPKTILTDHFFKSYKINSLEQLSKLVYGKPWNKTDIAQVAVLLEAAVLNNDSIALEILNSSIEELIKMIEVVTKKLRIGERDFDLVTSGSILVKNKTFRQKFVEEIEKIYPKANILKPIMHPSQAAALLAKEENN